MACIGAARASARADIVAWLRSLPQDEWYPANVAEAIESGRVEEWKRTNAARTK